MKIDPSSFILGIPIGVVIGYLYRVLSRATYKYSAFRSRGDVVSIEEARLLIDQGWCIVIHGSDVFFPALVVPIEALDGDKNDHLRHGKLISRFWLTESQALKLFPRGKVENLDRRFY